MAFFPSAVTEIKQQPSFLQQAGEAMQLKQLSGQNQIQQIELENARQAQSEQQTLMQLYKKNNGDLGKTIQDAADSGQIRPSTLLSLNQQHLKMQTDLAGLEEKHLTNALNTGNILAGDLDSLKQIPVEQRADRAKSILAMRSQQGLDVSVASQMIQRMPDWSDKSVEDSLETPLIGHNKAAELELARRKQTTEEQKADIEAKSFAAKQPGGTLEPVENREINDWLKKNPGKGPSDYVAWKAKQSPIAMVMGNQLGPGGAGTALDQQAELYSQTHELPSGLARSPGTTAAIIKRSAELHPEQNLAANQADFKSLQTSLSSVQKTFSNMSAFEGTALKNLDLYAQTLKGIPDLGFKAGNTPLRMISRNIIGDANYSAMEAARQTAASEVAKVLGSATGSGVLSDTQKREAQDIINGNLPLKATLKVIDTLKQDMANRHQSYQMQIDDLKGKLGQKQTPPATNAPSSTFSVPAGAPPAPKEDNKVLKVDGKIVARSKGGQWVAP